jgi:RimJ/RimL family protein N-acetyltransferase
MRVLETERILLKPIEPEDLSFLMNLRWDKEVSQNIIHDPISSQDQKNWYEKISKGNNLALSIFYKNSKDDTNPVIIGTIGLYDINHRHQRATLKSMRILPQYQGQNIGLEATNLLIDYGFNVLNLHKITCDLFEDNIARLKGLLKLGFKKEGVLKQHYFHQGKFKDAAIYSLLRKNYIFK